jgi:deoxyribonuclease V
VDVREAERVQDELRALVELGEPGPQELGTVAGLDVSYAGDRRADRLSRRALVE